jgi:prepilin-type N-terminal cleavage/methylation domain-containing protein
MTIRPVSIRSFALSHRGFTLVELALALAMIAIITAMAIPRLAESLARQSVHSASDQFVLAHSLARSSAIRFGRVSELHIDTLASRFWVEVDTNGSGVHDTIGFLRNLTGDRVVTRSNRTLLCFDPRGLASTSGTCQAGDAQVVFTRASMADTVRVTTLGKVLR